MASGTDEMRHMAQKVWSMLDRLAESDPDEYQKFVRQAMEEGKEYLDPPQPVMCLCTGVRGVSGEARRTARKLCYFFVCRGRGMLRHSLILSFSHFLVRLFHLLCI